MLVIDPNALPKDVDLLHQIVVELCERLKHETACGSEGDSKQQFDLVPSRPGARAV